MNFYRRFPYTNLNDINLDWIIKKVKALIGVVDEKQDKPATTGTAGQVLGLDENLNPVWLDQSGGTSDYNNLTSKPQIESVTLSGNKTAAELGLARITLVDEKQDKPSNAGTAGQVLGLDENLTPVWLDQTGGGGTSDYNNLTSKPQIESVTLSGNKTAAELGLARASDVPTKTSDLTNDSGFVNASEAAAAAPVQSVNGLSGGDIFIAIPSASSALPQMDGVASAGSNFSQFARGDHVHPNDTSKQDKITASGVLKGNGSGGVSAASIGSDFGAFAFTVTLAAAGWSSNAQTVSNVNFIASGYGYIVSPASDSFADYTSAQIYADDVTVDGQMAFHCMTAPSAALTVNVLRVVSA